MPRLPIPGEDAGSWGSVLNEYLNVSHNSDGTLKPSILAAKEDTANKGTVDGYAGLDSSGLVPQAQLPVARPPVTLTDQAVIATNASLGNHFIVTLGGSRTLGAPTNPSDGQRILWEFIQDGAGSRTITLNAVFALGTDITNIVLTTAAGKRDFMGAVYSASASKWFVIAFTRGY